MDFGYSREWNEARERQELREQLLLGARLARASLAAIGECWRATYKIRKVIPHRTLSDCNAYITARKIEAPWPTTTRARLYVAAEQIAHVVFKHEGRWSPYIEAFEAQLF